MFKLETIRAYLVKENNKSLKKSFQNYHIKKLIKTAICQYCSLCLIRCGICVTFVVKKKKTVLFNSLEMNHSQSKSVSGPHSINE